jgi:Protein of unknown function (DUF2844)
MLDGKILARIDEMKSRSLRILLLLLATLSLFPARAIATLGDPAQSIAADQQVLGGQLKAIGPQQYESEERQQPSSPDSYTVEQISTPAGVTVNEYVSSSGNVFAVSWRGPRPPDLSQLLGSYFSEYQTAVAAPHPQRRHLVVRTQDLVVETGGHMRDLRGRAYIPSMLPTNVSTEEIR